MVTTYACVSRYGWSIEANTVIQALGPRFGFLNVLLALKLVMVSLMYFAIKKILIEKANVGDKHLKYLVGTFSISGILVNFNNILVLVCSP